MFLDDYQRGKYREHYLQFETESIHKDETYHLSLSEKNYINVTAYLSEDKSVDLLSCAKDGMIDYHADEDAEVYAVYVAVDPYEPVGKLCVDYLSKEALQNL